MIKEEDWPQQFVYLGVIKLSVSGQSWNNWLLKDFSNSHPLSMQQIQCTFKINDQDAVFTSYTLQLLTPIEQFSFPIEAQQRHLCRVLQNFIENKWLQIRNPLNVPKTAVRPQRQEQQKMNHWVSIQLESKEISELCIQIWMRKDYLFECTKIYIKLNSMAKSGHYLQAFGEHKQNNQNIQHLQTRDFIQQILDRLENQQQALSSISKKLLDEEKLPQEIDPIDQKNIELKFKSDTDPGIYFDLIKENVKLSETPPGFQGVLKDYQKKSLTWMLFRENFIDDIGINVDHTPFWFNYRQKLSLPFDLYALRYLSKNILVWNKKVNKTCLGGILADEMGLGKTIMMISLMLAHKPDTLYGKRTQTLIIVPKNLVSQWIQQIRTYAPDLKIFYFRGSQDNVVDISVYDAIITTQTIIRNQYKKKMEKPKSQSFKHNIFSHDEECKLIQNWWFRIIIDEAHIFKNPKSLNFSALCYLESQFRWCMTGTPIQNSIHDLYALIKFLKFEPWCDLTFWKSEIEGNSRVGKDLSQQPVLKSSLKMKQIFKGIMLRRKKNSRNQNGEKVLDLPEQSTFIRYINMEPDARQAYRYIKERAEIELQKIKKVNEKIQSWKQNKKYEGIKSKLQEIWKQKLFRSVSMKVIKLRQLCCHSFMYAYIPKYISIDNYENEYRQFLSKQNVTRKRKQNVGDFALKWLHRSERAEDLAQVYDNWNSRLREIGKGSPKQCWICKNLCIQGIITPCLHSFCKYCLKNKIDEQMFESKIQQIERQEQLAHYDQFSEVKSSLEYEVKNLNSDKFETTCPMCGEQLMLCETFPLPQFNNFNRSLKQLKYNQKFKKILTEIRLLPHQQKCLLYTSLVGMVFLLEEALKRQFINFVSIKGDDPMSKRDRTIKQFNQKKHIKVLIMTLKTGSMGLNLQAANHVFITDPWWNPSIEEQAVGRAHRLGQDKKVSAIKFVASNSIEARMIKFGLQKKSISNSFLDVDEQDLLKNEWTNMETLKYMLEMDEDEEYDEEKKEKKEENVMEIQEQGEKKIRIEKIELQGNPDDGKEGGIKMQRVEQRRVKQEMLGLCRNIKKQNKYEGLVYKDKQQKPDKSYCFWFGNDEQQNYYKNNQQLKQELIKNQAINNASSNPEKTPTNEEYLHHIVSQIRKDLQQEEPQYFHQQNK